MSSDGLQMDALTCQDEEIVFRRGETKVNRITFELLTIE